MAASGAALLFPVGAPERADGEPGEEHAEGEVEGQVVVAPSGGPVELPGVEGETHREESEEEAGDLEPEDPGGVGKGMPEGGAEAACSPGEAAAACGDRCGGRDAGPVRRGAGLRRGGRWRRSYGWTRDGGRLGWGAEAGAVVVLVAWAVRLRSSSAATRAPIPRIRPRRLGCMGKV
jgi:hypothetical protein